MLHLHICLLVNIRLSVGSGCDITSTAINILQLGHIALHGDEPSYSITALKWAWHILLSAFV